MHIYMYVWTYLHMGSFGTEVYIYVGYIYMEVFSMQPRDQTFILVCILLWGSAEMILSAGTLTTNA